MRLKRPAARRKLASQPSVPRPNASRRPVRTPLRRSDVPKRSAPSRKPSVLLRKSLLRSARPQRKPDFRLKPVVRKRLASQRKSAWPKPSALKRRELPKKSVRLKSSVSPPRRRLRKSVVNASESARPSDSRNSHDSTPRSIRTASVRARPRATSATRDRTSRGRLWPATTPASSPACVRTFRSTCPAPPAADSSSPNSSSGRCPTANLPALPSTRRSQAGMPTTRPYATPS